jgi:hypothetical protein
MVFNYKKLRSIFELGGEEGSSSQIICHISGFQFIYMRIELWANHMG